ncbi:MAG: YigZ family protein [Clostridiales bacterium]|nr:YigZ family protein [Clostridiales bacterium]
MGEVTTFTTIKEEGVFHLIEKKSEFIGYAKPIRSEQEAVEMIGLLRKKHADARHHVYAYVVGGVMRYSDDGEPQGTGGVPVLDVIRKNNVDGALIVVVRYFGGVLLGAGGLTRAYSAAAKGAIAKAQIVVMQRFIETELVCQYADYAKILRDLERFHGKMDCCEYADVITLSIAVRFDQLESLQKHLYELSAGRLVLRETGWRYDYEMEG